MDHNSTDTGPSYQSGTNTMPTSPLAPTDDTLVDDDSKIALRTAPDSIESSASLNSNHPSNYLVQASLITAQIFFGLGGVISALGLPACNPFAFALYREIAAGSILLAASTCLATPYYGPHEHPPPRIDWQRFALLGLTLFGNQACVIVGIKLAGPVAAAVWQPSQPIMTAAISMILGWESLDIRRISGVLISFGGCAIMVVLSTKDENEGLGIDDGGNLTDGNLDASLSNHMLRLLVGHALFFTNCLCTSLYVLLSKKPLRVYPPIKVTAWSYNTAAVFMASTAYLTSLSKNTMEFLCPDCTTTWRIPTGAEFALLYAIVFNSVLAYFFITWSNQYATGTLVIGYSVLQPVTAALVTAILLGIGTFPSCNTIDAGVRSEHNENMNDAADAHRCLDPPNAGTMLGMMGVFAGLALVILTEPNKDSTDVSFQYEKVAKQEDRSKPQLAGDLELT